MSSYTMQRRIVVLIGFSLVALVAEFAIILSRLSAV